MTFARHPGVEKRARRAGRPAGHQVDVGEKLPQRGLSHWFSQFASRTANATGSHWAFLAMVVFIVTWAVTGPLFGFSDSWQLIANTVTTLTTALMVFLIQNTQNRDSRAIHLKLDELIRAVPRARKEFMEAEEEDLDEIEREKAIVDKDDPNPPADRVKPEVRSARPPTAKAPSARPPSGNGKPH